KSGLDIFFEYAFQLCGNGGTHEMEGVHRKEWIPSIGPDVEAVEKTFGFERLKFGLVLDAGEGLRRRLVVRGLEDAAKQDRDIFKLHADPFLDRWNRLMTEEGIGAAEVEQELRGGRVHGRSPS